MCEDINSGIWIHFPFYFCFQLHQTLWHEIFGKMGNNTINVRQTVVIKFYLFCFCRKRITLNSSNFYCDWSKYHRLNQCVLIDFAPYSLNFYGKNKFILILLSCEHSPRRHIMQHNFHNLFDRKSSWLSPDDIEIDWRPLYKLSQIFIRKNTSKDELYRYFS